MSQTTNPTTIPAFMRRMTPEKYKAMSKDARRAYDRKVKAHTDAMEANIDQRNAEANKNLAFGIAKLIADNPRIEWEIVSTYLERTGQVLVNGDFCDQNPRFVQAVADFELERLRQARSRKASSPAAQSTARKSA